MKFVITGGGTAGHINPALAIACELADMGHSVYYAGKPDSMESRLVPKQGFEFKSFSAAGFNRQKPWTLLTSGAKIWFSSRKARKWLKTLKPDAVIGFGGYVSIPVGMAAAKEKIPLIVHEQNSASGLANRFLAKHADIVALTYKSAEKDFKAATATVVVGNPVRASLLQIDALSARKYFKLPQDAKVLLVFGGSLGARHLNECIIDNAKKLMSIQNLHVLHVTGIRDFDEMQTRLSAQGDLTDRWHLIDYCDRMGEAYHAADVVLSRSGATTLAELAALTKPALLVPYPMAAADEQTKNAGDLVDAGAADMIADKDMDKPIFMDKLLKLLTDDDYLSRMKDCMNKLGYADARQKLTALIIETVNKKITAEKS